MAVLGTSLYPAKFLPKTFDFLAGKTGSWTLWISFVLILVKSFHRFFPSLHQWHSCTSSIMTQKDVLVWHHFEAIFSHCNTSRIMLHQLTLKPSSARSLAINFRKDWPLPWERSETILSLFSCVRKPIVVAFVECDVGMIFCHGTH